MPLTRGYLQFKLSCQADIKTATRGWLKMNPAVHQPILCDFCSIAVFCVVVATDVLSNSIRYAFCCLLS